MVNSFSKNCLKYVSYDKPPSIIQMYEQGEDLCTTEFWKDQANILNCT